MIDNQKIVHKSGRDSLFLNSTRSNAYNGATFKREQIETPYTKGFSTKKTPIEKALEKPTSLRLAINAKCFDCIGCGFDPKPTDAIRNCEINGCPLWPVRPYQTVKG
ncbi:hypothetical protein [Marinicella litoralis]|uniref:Uncharacterized protein n=1 Tax=Marinicella litoralis TaxID=644220 RepID=A0A4R6Y433_9GAMM|nr:hypothetical protein [Marinicella litoralis]TDR23898.1 hypothetical protein C8D91_0766 [Marinicella litoralis]